MLRPEPDIAELERAIAQYKHLVYGIALAELRNRHEADDVFQEVFLLYYIKSPKFESETARKAWLIKTTCNYCRRCNTSIWNTRVDKTDAIDNETAVFRSDEENQLFEAVRELDEKYRQIVILYYFENMPVDEICRVLGLKSGTVQSRLHRARKKLRERLEGEYFG